MIKDWNKKIIKASLDPDAGFLFIYKEPGWTSHDIVAKLRNILNIKKIGHAGTLDPLASGLLIIGLGKATTLLEYWHQFPKTYIAKMELGKISDTFDIEGNIKITKNKKIITQEDFKKILSNFLGKQFQNPPAFSAKKINGKKAYELARAGKEVKLKAKEIKIFNIDLIKFENKLATIKVTCSTGTYIRSLINDIGKKLTVGAIMSGLERTSIGPINTKQAIKLKNINPGALKKLIFKPQHLKYLDF